MINTNNKCECGHARPSFGIVGKKATNCVKCKTDEMVRVIGKKCKCGSSNAIYGINRPTHCIKCKTDNMISLRNKKCFCKRSNPSFGIKGGKRTHCAKCKTPEMINLSNTKCLCGKANAIFGIRGKKPKCCSQCKTSQMINLACTKCSSNYSPYNIQCDIEGNKKYDGFCTHCFANLFPDNPKTKMIRTKSKELQVVNYISTRIKGFYHDKPLYVNLNDPGCDCSSKRRIDLRKLIGNTMLCIEVDENQHRGYCEIDEEKRYNELVSDFTGNWVFIRYNPDKYKDSHGKCRNPKMEKRLEKLLKETKRYVEKIENGGNTDLIEIFHLYFDEK